MTLMAVPALTFSQTFTKDIAPIFQEKCQSCHRDGSIAPMSLVTYEETRPWAQAIKSRVAARQMPPWHMDKHVGIQDFKNDRSLSDEQIALLARYVKELSANKRDKAPEAELAAATRTNAPQGVLAYSAVCTHAGCIDWAWQDDRGTLKCPCHDSEFDLKDGARVTVGPATVRLAALPLEIVGGALVAAGGFVGKVGFTT